MRRCGREGEKPICQLRVRRGPETMDHAPHIHTNKTTVVGPTFFPYMTSDRALLSKQKDEWYPLLICSLMAAYTRISPSPINVLPHSTHPRLSFSSSLYLLSKLFHQDSVPLPSISSGQHFLVPLTYITEVHDDFWGPRLSTALPNTLNCIQYIPALEICIQLNTLAEG